VDSVTLNCRWNGQLALAIGVDGHNWMYLIAFGFFDSETHENWTWFMIHLRRAIGNLPLLAVSTDAWKGLENAVKEVFPHAKKRECFRHMMQNYVKRFPGGAEHMYPVARAYRNIVHEHHLAIVREKLDVCYWLDTYHSLLWYISGFNLKIKCDYVTNNVAESFNNWIKDKGPSRVRVSRQN
jgi:transposase-like protein